MIDSRKPSTATPPHHHLHHGPQPFDYAQGRHWHHPSPQRWDHTYLYGLDRIAQTQGTTTDYFLTDALGSMRQLTDAGGAVTYASAYDPYGVTTQAFGASQTSYGFTGEYTSNELVYLRARHYAPEMGRFLTKDSWMGDYNDPLSLNRWMYVQGNPVNYVDPSGLRAWCPWGWNQWAVNWRVDVAEKYVSKTSDPMDTYTAAGIAIQCAGTNWNRSVNNSGEGIAQITKNEAKTEYGVVIPKRYWWDSIR